jgi:hypothetical protein
MYEENEIFMHFRLDTSTNHSTEIILQVDRRDSGHINVATMASKVHTEINLAQDKFQCWNFVNKTLYFVLHMSSL